MNRACALGIVLFVASSMGCTAAGTDAETVLSGGGGKADGSSQTALVLAPGKTQSFIVPCDEWFSCDVSIDLTPRLDDFDPLGYLDGHAPQAQGFDALDCLSLYRIAVAEDRDGAPQLEDFQNLYCVRPSDHARWDIDHVQLPKQGPNARLRVVVTSTIQKLVLDDGGQRVVSADDLPAAVHGTLDLAWQ